MTHAGLDLIIVGAGLRGLHAAAVRLRDTSSTEFAVIEARPEPGGRTRTRRTEGFVCEHGPFAFGRIELDRLRAPLTSPPAMVAALPGLTHGAAWMGTGLEPRPLAETPYSFPGGAEDLVGAYRRELGPRLRLGRSVVAVAGEPGRFRVALGGEVPAELTAARLVLATPLRISCELMAGFDPRLGPLVGRLAPEPRAFVFLGFDRGEFAAAEGYGVLDATGAEPVAEVIFCSNVFAGRALPGRVLMRAEVVGEAAGQGEDEIAATVLRMLQAWLGAAPRPLFQRVFRFTTMPAGGARVEALLRLRELAARGGAIEFAGTPVQE